MVELTVSVAVTVRVPAVLKVMATPLATPLVNVGFAGSIAAPSLEVMAAVPV
jgi:hypothetical protein